MSNFGRKKERGGITSHIMQPRQGRYRGRGTWLLSVLLPGPLEPIISAGSAVAPGRLCLLLAMLYVTLGHYACDDLIHEIHLLDVHDVIFVTNTSLLQGLSCDLLHLLEV